MIKSLREAGKEKLDKKIRSIGACSDGNYVIRFMDNDEVKIPMYK